MIEVVCGVIRNSVGEFLACLRPEGKHLAGLWEFPGGKLEAGETPAEGLVRELREELGVEVVVQQALTPVEWRHERGEICLRPFLCGISSGELQPIEHTELRWCAADELSLLNWAPADVPVCNELLVLKDFHDGISAIRPETAS